MKISFALTAFLFVAPMVRAEVREDFVRLRKLSIHLRGIAPKRAEYEALAARVNAGAREAFFAAKTAEYLDSRSHIAKMVERLHALYRFAPPPRSLETFLNLKNYDAYSEDAEYDERKFLNAEDVLFIDLLAKNQSWDLLLTSKKYYFDHNRDDDLTRESDHGFLSQVAAPKPAPDDKSNKPKPEDPNDPARRLNVENFDANDPRIAGSITTARFAGRYGTSTVNKNRRRAAAVFRMFLCDDMQASVEVVTGTASDPLLDEVFPVKNSGGTASAEKISVEKRHGTDPSCVKCHSKLDPMGNAFMAMSAVLASEPTPGALVFTNKAGQAVNIPVKGLGELGQRIVEQPEYAECQVKQFWNWFIGDDMQVSDSRLAQLVSKFNEFGHRPREFIAYLVNEPDFYKVPEQRKGAPLDLTGPTPAFSAVKPILQNCTNCHVKSKEDVPDLTVLPFDKSESHNFWVREIGKQLDFAHDGAQPKMPPKNSDWRPTKPELDILRAWIAGRARDATGAPTIEAETAARVTSARQVNTLRPELNHGFFRYLSGFDVLRSLQYVLADERINDKNAQGFGYISSDCQFGERREQIQDEVSLGFPLPMTGEAIQKEPTMAYLTKYIECLKNTVDNSLAIYDRMLHPQESDTYRFNQSPEKIRQRIAEDTNKYIGAAAAAHMDRSAKLSVFNLTWEKVSLDARKEIALHLIRELIGPNVIADEAGLAARLEVSARSRVIEKKRYSDYGSMPSTDKDPTRVRDAVTKIILTLALSDDYMTY